MLINLALRLLFLFLFATTSFAIPLDFTVLDAKQYHATVLDSRQKIQKILQELQTQRKQSADAQINYIVDQLLNIPYETQHAMGEGDWQPRSKIYLPGAIHIAQDPVYRLDRADCQTFVQLVMALLFSKNLNEFDANYLKISYGAAGNPRGEIVRLYNRNHFVDGDFNPINQRHGWLQDASLLFLPFTKTITATISRQAFFSHQQQNSAEYVRVLHAKDGPAMVQRLLHNYSDLPFKNFKSQKITISYFPKTELALKQMKGGYAPNQMLLDKIPTPAVVEIIRDPKLWKKDGMPIKDFLGSETTVSHLGILYRKTFTLGEMIYQKMYCMNFFNRRRCQVSPVRCEQKQCVELMFAHATDSHPNDSHWNRVERLPLFDYLTNYQYSSYVYMNDPSILGVHIEKIKI